MQNTKRYFRIGLLTALAMVLLVGSMFFLGLADEFTDRLHFATTFSESVQGLTLGAPVKFKGVPIGKVAKITILPKEHIIRVDMLVETNVFASLAGKQDVLRRGIIKEFYRREREHIGADGKEKDGLCCFLELTGITGFRYIEMDYKKLDVKRRNIHTAIQAQIEKEKDVLYFPSAPNTFNNIVDSVRISLAKIAQINIDEITTNLNNNLTALNAILSDPALKRTIDRLDSISQNAETITRSFSENFTAEELEKLLSGVDRSLINISEAAQNLSNKIAEVEPSKLTRQAEKVMQSANNTLVSLREDSVDVMKVIQQINTTVQNVNRLVEELKRDPSALIRGKSAEPVELE